MKIMKGMKNGIKKYVLFPLHVLHDLHGSLNILVAASDSEFIPLR
jgi:hypothetical protein